MGAQISSTVWHFNLLSRITTKSCLFILALPNIYHRGHGSPWERMELTRSGITATFVYFDIFIVRDSWMFTGGWRLPFSSCKRSQLDFGAVSRPVCRGNLQWESRTICWRHETEARSTLMLTNFLFFADYIMRSYSKVYLKMTFLRISPLVELIKNNFFYIVRLKRDKSHEQVFIFGLFRYQTLIYELNTSGKYFAFREQLKYSVIKIVREKYLRTTNFESQAELQVRMERICLLAS